MQLGAFSAHFLCSFFIMNAFLIPPTHTWVALRMIMWACGGALGGGAIGGRANASPLDLAFVTHLHTRCPPSHAFPYEPWAVGAAQGEACRTYHDFVGSPRVREREALNNFTLFTS